MTNNEDSVVAENATAPEWFIEEIYNSLDTSMNDVCYDEVNTIWKTLNKPENLLKIAPTETLQKALFRNGVGEAKLESKIARLKEMFSEKASRYGVGVSMEFDDWFEIFEALKECE